MALSYYAPWCPGLPEDRDALGILKQAGFEGVELSNLENYEPILESGLKVSLHNVIREYWFDLCNPDYKSAFNGQEKPKLQRIKDSGTRIFSGHGGYFIRFPEELSKMNNQDGTYNWLNKDFIVKTISDNLNYLASELISDNMLAAVETPPYVQISLHDCHENSFPCEKLNEAISYITGQEYVRDLMQHLKKGAGFLFDISHVYVSGFARQNSESMISPEEHTLNILRAAGKKTLQLHLNIPGKDRDKISDEHFGYSPNEELSEIIMGLAREVIQGSPCLKVVTLEMQTDKIKETPKEHAIRMASQLELISERLG